MTTPVKLLSTVLATAALIAAGFFVLGSTDLSRGSLLRATALPQALPLPDFTLTDHDGQPFVRDRFLGRFSLVFFGFTHCPDICPATLLQLVVSRNQIAAAGGAVPDIVLVSVDPERDTPEILADYTANFGDDVYGVTGDIDELIKLTSALGIFFEKTGASGVDTYNVAHSAAVLLINGDAELIALFSAPHDIDALVNDLPLLMTSG